MHLFYFKFIKFNFSNLFGLEYHYEFKSIFNLIKNYYLNFFNNYLQILRTFSFKNYLKMNSQKYIEHLKKEHQLAIS